MAALRAAKPRTAPPDPTTTQGSAHVDLPPAQDVRAIRPPPCHRGPRAQVGARQAGVVPRVAVDLYVVTWVQGRDPGFELRSSPGPSSRGGAQVRLPSVDVDQVQPHAKVRTAPSAPRARAEDSHCVCSRRLAHVVHVQSLSWCWPLHSGLADTRRGHCRHRHRHHRHRHRTRLIPPPDPAAPPRRVPRILRRRRLHRCRLRRRDHRRRRLRHQPN